MRGALLVSLMRMAGKRLAGQTTTFELIVLISLGVVLDSALDREGISRDELMAGLRKLGHDTPEAVRLAVHEETGHISAVAFDDPAHVESRPMPGRCRA